jgi:endonuclease YncB( thermonuclease family)
MPSVTIGSFHAVPRLVARLAVFTAAILFAGGAVASAQLVTRVVDGDTIVVAGVGTVRLIGVDTPETVDPRRPVQDFGQEASAFTKQLAQGKIVRLEFEGPRTDRYRRTLAYVYLPDGRLLNAEIIKQGYGHAYVEFPFGQMAVFRQHERDARNSQRGLWIRTAPVVTASSSVTVYVTPKGEVYHRLGCRYLKGTTTTAMTVADAVDHYRACQICKPPIG